MGDSGENILLLNQKLIAKGYLSESLDGFDYYNWLTTDAVKKAQHDFGFEETGIVDEELWEKPCEAPSLMRLKMGDSGEKVLLLNQKLIAMGYLSESLDGFDYYNWLTTDAVKKAQHDLGFEETGIVEEELWNKLYEEPSPIRLKMGDSGENVLLLNQKLIEMGYLSELLDGFDYYNWLTTDAVKKAQHDFGYEETGTVDEELWNKLREM